MGSSCCTAAGVMAAAPASEILPQFPFFFHTGGNEFASRSAFRMDDAYILCKFGPEVEQQQLLPLLLLPVLLIGWEQTVSDTDCAFRCVAGELVIAARRVSDERALVVALPPPPAGRGGRCLLRKS